MICNYFQTVLTLICKYNMSIFSNIIILSSFSVNSFDIFSLLKVVNETYGTRSSRRRHASSSSEEESRSDNSS